MNELMYDLKVLWARIQVHTVLYVQDVFEEGIVIKGEARE